VESILVIETSALRLLLETGLNKVAIKRKGGLGSMLFHNDEGYAVCERIVLVLMLLKISPALPK